jgi:hypothetical protein
VAEAAHIQSQVRVPGAKNFMQFLWLPQQSSIYIHNIIKGVKRLLQ